MNWAKGSIFWTCFSRWVVGTLECKALSFFLVVKIQKGQFLDIGSGSGQTRKKTLLHGVFILLQNIHNLFLVKQVRWFFIQNLNTSHFMLNVDCQ